MVGVELVDHVGLHPVVAGLFELRAKLQDRRMVRLDGLPLLILITPLLIGVELVGRVGLHPVLAGLLALRAKLPDHRMVRLDGVREVVRADLMVLGFREGIGLPPDRACPSSA